MILVTWGKVPAMRQRGMTLIEILVAIVVLSVGLLGLAGLQLKGMQVNQGSTYRSQAAVLAHEIAERMRADRTGAIAGAYTVTGVTPTTPSVAMSDWLTRVQMLPGGTATILAPVPGTTPGSQVINVTVNWTDSRAQTASGVSSAAVVQGAFFMPVEL